MKIVIIDYGAGNIFSVQTAFRRLGYAVTVSSDAAEIVAAERVVFPGVGQASAAMQKLSETGLDRLIPQLTMPVLGICLGMQLLCRHSEEDDTPGLGVLPVDVKEIVGEVRVPHIGWNTIGNLKTPLFDGIAENERMYFVHSYYVPLNDCTIAECSYHLPFSAAIRKDNFYGCQFHPEKSSSIGEKILSNFIHL